MNGRVALLILATASLALALPPAQAEADLPVPEPEKCAPPCGYIYPIIGVDAETPKDQLKTAKIADFPTTQKIRLTYSWDMDQEGTGIPGDADEMTITTLVSKKPLWIRQAVIEPTTCSFRINPAVSEYAPESCVLDLKVTLDPTYLPMEEEDLDHNGKRLMLFATSRESGTFKPGYGVEDMRWKWDGPPDVSGFGAEAPAPRDDATVEESPIPVLLLPLTVAALALLARSRRPDPQ